MKIEWNKVTWYSNVVAIVVFLATFGVAFYLGVYWEQKQIDETLMTTPVPTDTGGGIGAHCAGFIRNAPTCNTGLHCQLKVSMPDTGGVCVPN